MNNTNSPYATYATNAAPKLDMDISNQLKVHQSEEQNSKAPKVLPHPGESSLVEIVGSMYEKLIDVKKTLSKIEQEPKRNKESIQKAKIILDDIGKKIIELYEPLDKLYL